MSEDTGQAAADLLEGAIDAHVHGAPDVVERLMTAIELAQDAATQGMAGILLLNHYSDTTPQAVIVDSLVEDVTVRGGIKLNRPAGGLNPDAVQVALDLGAAKVDMPTQHAKNELEKKGKDHSRGITVVDGDDLRPEVDEILSLVADSTATIATGHLSPEEVEAVIEAAVDHGIDRPVVSHPTLASIDLPVDTQIQLAERGAMIEYCYVNTTDVLRSHYEGWQPLAPSEILEHAAAVGPESAMLATDFGQPSNLPPATGLRNFIVDALEFGFSETEIGQMVRENPRRTYDFD